MNTILLDQEKSTISGTITKIIHPKQREAFKGFLVASVKDDSGDIKIAGRSPILPSLNDQVIIQGEWETTDYGKQLTINQIAIDRSVETGGLAAYIANNPKVKYVGKAKIQKLLDTFGEAEALLDAIKTDAEGVARSISIKTDYIFALAEALSEDKQLLSCKAWLAGLGMTDNQINKIIDKYGWISDTVIQDNPYKLIDDIEGWGFTSVDQWVAKRINVSSDDPKRLSAGLLYCLKSVLDDGDTYVERNYFLKKANEMLCLNTLDAMQKIEAALERLIESKRVIIIPDHDGCYTLPSLYAAEKYIHEQIKKFGRAQNPHKTRIKKDFPKFQKVFYQRFQKTLNECQTQALQSSITNAVNIITGSAGTGKTFTIQAIGEAYKYAGLRVTCCAFAGKAARRIKELTGLHASTIHRLLEYNPYEKSFARNQDRPLETDVVIVDEASMIDSILIKDLFLAIDFQKTCLIMVGDHNQLPPVGNGHFFRDVIADGVVPTTRLQTVVRQGGILNQNSNAILNGVVAPTYKYLPKEDDGRTPWYVIGSKDLGREASNPEHVRKVLLEIIEHRIDKLGFDFYRDCQVLTSMNERGVLSVKQLNSDIQRIVQKKYFNNDIETIDPSDIEKGEHTQARTNAKAYAFFDKVHPNDRVIQLRNNYDLQVFNGTLGIVRSKDEKHKKLVIAFENGTNPNECEISGKALRDLSLAYCLTVHKAQGSEFPCVITICHKSHYIMLHRNWLYTAVTRAQQCSILIGDSRGIQIASQKIDQNQRKTILQLLRNP